MQLKIAILQNNGWCVLVVWTLSSVNSAASASFWWITLASPSCLFTHSVGAANCSHAAVMCWIVSDSFPHLLHSSAMCGCFKIYFFSYSFLLIWLGPVLLLKSPLFRQTNPRLSAICSTLLCLHTVGWDHTDVGRITLYGTFVFSLC